MREDSTFEVKHTFSNGRLHETRQRWQDVDRRVNLTIMQLTVNVNLSLRDITCMKASMKTYCNRSNVNVNSMAVNNSLRLKEQTCQIRDGMSDVVVGHSKDRNLRDGTVSPFNATSAFVDRCQI